MPHLPLRLRPWTLAAATLLPPIALAQQLPDAGSVLRQIEPQRQAPLPARSEAPPAAPPMTAPAGGATVTVQRFEFRGNTLLPTEQLTAAVAPWLKRPLGFGELQAAAMAVATLYREAGWVVRAYLPQQDISQGGVTIQIVEGRFGAVRLNAQGTRAPAAQVRALVEAAQPAGQPVRAPALDRALLLIDDLPGAQARGQLAAGRAEGETDLAIDLADGPLLGGTLSLDNTGARSTGSTRLLGSASLYSPFGRGEQFDGTLLFTQGSRYLRAGASLPVGAQGWRVGASVSHLAYEVVTPEFEALNAQGDSSTLALDASYPLLRSRLRNLVLALSAEHRRFDNQSGNATITRYSLSNATLSLSGNLFDELGGGGANTANLSLTTGDVDLDGSPNAAADATTTRTAGGFRKLRIAVSRQQALGREQALFAAYSMQRASKNLDSSERFYLGGASGVRAYPASEGGASEGELLTLEWRLRLPGGLSGTLFHDRGRVKVNRNNSFTGAAEPNRYTLSGQGVALAYSLPSGLSVKATLARRSGQNPNATRAGTDQDGTLKRNRFWLQAQQAF